RHGVEDARERPRRRLQVPCGAERRDEPAAAGPAGLHQLVIPLVGEVPADERAKRDQRERFHGVSPSWLTTNGRVVCALAMGVPPGSTTRSSSTIAQPAKPPSFSAATQPFTSTRPRPSSTH